MLRRTKRGRGRGERKGERERETRTQKQKERKRKRKTERERQRQTDRQTNQPDLHFSKLSRPRETENCFQDMEDSRKLLSV